MSLELKKQESADFRIIIGGRDVGCVSPDSSGSFQAVIKFGDDHVSKFRKTQMEAINNTIKAAAVKYGSCMADVNRMAESIAEFYASLATVTNDPTKAAENDTMGA